MQREDFLNELRIALQGNITQARVNEHLRYYENYIIEESRKGRTETEVISALGNPRLIAKTIIDTEGNTMYADNETEQKEVGQELRKNFKWNLGIGLIVIILILLFVASVIPILFPLLIIGVILYLLFFGKHK